MMNCKHASQLISQSLDSDLPWQQRFALRLHLILCKYCLRFSQQLHDLRVVIQSMNKHAEDDTNITLPPKTKARIVKSMASNTD